MAGKEEQEAFLFSYSDSEFGLLNAVPQAVKGRPSLPELMKIKSAE